MANSSRKIARKMARAARSRRGITHAPTRPALRRLLPDEVPPAVHAEFAELERREAERRRRYGDVRPIIHEEFKGKRLVVVGSELHWGDADRLRWFPDFLLTYIWTVLTPEWGKSEMAKAREDRHAILRWKEDHYNFTRTLTPQADGTYNAVPDASTRAYILLAYDLYVVRDNAELQRRLVNRLRFVDQFQGARYELFAAATFIRAGFDVEFERETDGTGQHNEFIATHRVTGQKFVLEAKSRRRRGILGFTGGHEEPRDTMKIGIGQLLGDAIAKPAPHPRVVFIDINFPPERMEEGVLGLALIEMQEAVIAQQREDGLEPWNLIVFTNHPYPWVQPGVRFPWEFAWMLMPNRPVVAIAHPVALAAIGDALQQFGHVPMEFPENR